VNVREFSVELLVLQGLTFEEVETDRWFCEGRSKPGLDSFDQKGSIKTSHLVNPPPPLTPLS
jgi:hypothetical protein